MKKEGFFIHKIAQLPEHKIPVGLILYDKENKQFETINYPVKVEYSSETVDLEGMVKTAIRMRKSSPELGWRKIKKILGYPFSHVTLMKKCCEHLATEGETSDQNPDLSGNIEFI